MMYVILISLFTLFIVWRVSWINWLIDDWNNQLAIYIERLENNPAVDKRTIDYMKRNKIKPIQWYWRLDAWQIKHIVNDPFLIHEIHTQIQGRYK